LIGECLVTLLRLWVCWIGVIDPFNFFYCFLGGRRRVPLVASDDLLAHFPSPRVQSSMSARVRVRHRLGRVTSYICYTNYFLGLITSACMVCVLF
jgi:hypothetical protein